jgi:N-acetyl-1-D-myo-inositol-2-amino-2-deoxy-alpha-D-glucopyranoside deacetylase
VVSKLAGAIGSQRAMFSVPDEQIDERLDVTPWLEQKTAAILAHRTEVARGAVPGLVAAMPGPARDAFLSTEWYLRRAPDPAAASEVQR